MANTLKLGAGKWATGTDTVLAFNDENNNFKPLPFDFSRASSATVVNQSGLIETVGSGTPRIDFEGNTKGALLLEPSRTNSLLQSNQFDTTWTLSNTSISNNQSGIYNTTNAWKLIQNTNTGYHYIQQSLNLTGDYVYSIYAKKGEYEGISFFMPNPINGSNSASTFNLSTGSFTTNNHQGISFNVGNGWYRISLKTKLSGSHVVNAYVNQTTQQSEAGDGTSGIYIQHAQLEVGSYPTSIIPTSGSAVTRVADTCSQTVPSGIIGQTEGSVFFDLNTTLKNYSVISISDGTNANRVVFYFSAVLNQIASYITKSNVNSSTTSSIVNSYPNSNYKVVIKYNSIGFYIFANGGLIGTILSNYSFPNNTLNEIKLSSPDNSNFFEGKVKNIKVYNQLLTDSEAIALTTI